MSSRSYPILCNVVVFVILIQLLVTENRTLLRWISLNWSNASSPGTTQTQTVLRFLCVLQFNFVGKLLGPRGNSLKRLQEDTLTKMSILGKGSMRDKEKVQPHSFACFICLLSLLVSLLRPLVVPPPAAAHPSLG